MDPTPKTLITQGAEAHLYKTTFLTPSLPSLLKHRPPKPYRHPTLDTRLTKHRCLSESRLLIKAHSLGLPVPAVYYVDEARGAIYMEWIAGKSVREILDGLDEEGARRVMWKMGVVVGRMHMLDLVHGDLTTSNFMVRDVEDGKREDGEVVVVDFGLGVVSTAEEDKAVDLYVLERAVGSTHSRVERLFAEEVLRGYEGCYAGAREVLRRLRDVRLRGRKRSMVG